MKNIVERIIEESLAVKKAFFEKNTDSILEAADRLAVCLASGHKLLVFGNGGSAADSQHMAAEFVNRFVIERAPLAAIALTVDTSLLTAVGNDYSFEEIFSKQVRALGRPHDIAIGISTSGNSPNVLRAVEEAKKMGMFALGLSGRGGKLASAADLCLCVDSNATPRIQEVHITLIHVLCDLTDRILFPEAFSND